MSVFYFSVQTMHFSLNQNEKVIVRYLDVYGLICRSGWNMNAAFVLCRQKGFHWAKSIGDYVWNATGKPIWIKDVTCIGNEKSLHECNLGKLQIQVGCSKITTVSCHTGEFCAELPYFI
jgi:hypothetical protein